MLLQTHKNVLYIGGNQNYAITYKNKPFFIRHNVIQLKSSEFGK